MANKDYSLPHLDMINLVPQELRNPMLKSLVDNLFNRFLTKDEAIPLYGYVGRKPSSTDDRTPKIPQQTVERDINSLIPVLSFKVGTETFSFTVQDLIRKAEVLGVSTDQASWLFSQGNNYAPPIDLDRFTNFFNYQWVATALPNAPTMAWNPTLAPEYYTIAQPKPADLDKLNVVTSTNGPIVLTGTGFHPQTWVVEFQSATDFTVTATGAGLVPSEVTQAFSLPSVTTESSSTFVVNYIATGSTGPLLTFHVLRDPIYDDQGTWIGNESFGAGDTFTISAPFIASSYSVTPNSLSSGIKGKFTAVNSLDTYQTINGVLVKENDRILVKDQGNSTENGIYVVMPGAFVRAVDYSGSTIVAGAKVFDSTHSLTFISTVNHTWVLDPSTVSNTNDWQEFNFWMHRDDVAAAGYDTTKVIQATRPIIEFHSNVQLNTRYNISLGALMMIMAYTIPNVTPTDDVNFGTEYQQRKTEFNQFPLFDLYRYDGTHAGKTTPLFFYAEDPTAAIDPALQRRTKLSTNTSADFLFTHGLLDGDTSLFYKTTDGALHSIWHPGYSSIGSAATQVTDAVFTGTGNGTFHVAVTDPFTDQQIWTLTALSASTFSISGSKTKTIPSPYDVITVGAPYSNGVFNISITAGSTPFIAGDVYTFRVGNFETTRYVYRDANDDVFDFFGGPAADTHGVGAWQVPRMFYNNVGADNGGELPEGTLYSHFRGILQNQISGLQEDRAFGGSIKLWSEQQNLLASLLMQRDMTPISMIDFAQRQYEGALAQVTDIFLTELVQYFGTAGVVNTTAELQALVNQILAVRAKDNDVKTILYDSTAGVVGFPATLPMLGVTPLVKPGISFDNELGLDLMVHHDGHKSPVYTFTQELRDRMLSPGMLVKRSDGTYTAAVGSFTSTAPVNPYMGELWFYPLNGTQVLRAFDVISDGSVAPTATVSGQYWYNRGIQTLYVWSGSQWNIASSVLDAWVDIDPAVLLNDVILEVENRLYDGTNEEQRTYFSNAEIATSLQGTLGTQLERELSTWAAANGYDPYAPDYVSTDAFTWNYRSLGMPARWYRALWAHQQAVGVQLTSRPNLEPWKLAGHATKPTWWDTSYASLITPDNLSPAATASARVVVFSDSAVTTPLTGLPVIDGRVLQNGDVVLLVSESAAANNGLWVVSSGTWSRAATPLVDNLVVTVVDGAGFSGTEWVLPTAPVVLNVSPTVFVQARYWKRDMWFDIMAATPALKISVDINRADLLLPPYVNAGLPTAAYALTNTMPSAPAAAYVFGEGSPVETVWMKTIEFRYSLARALFRNDPLTFLGHCWGFSWVEVDGILYDGFDIAVPGHKRFRLHGDTISNVNRTTPFAMDFTGIVTGPGPVDLYITYNGYTDSRAQSFMVKTADDTIIGYMHEGTMSTVSGSGYLLQGVKIEDEGKPFRMGDRFHVTAASDGSGLSIVFEPASYAQVFGFGQIFAQALRASSVDMNQGFALQAYRGWNVNLGYRAGGLVSTDDLRVFTDTETLPTSSYELRFNRSQYAKDLWVHGLRVTVVQMGANKPAPVSGFIPTNDASDWVFRVEGYNSRFLGIDYYVLNTSGEYMTFNALSGAHTSLEFKHYTEVLGTAHSELPITITGLQNLVTFLYGYSTKLEADGWRFQDEDGGNVDAATGRIQNWQLEIEKTIDAVYAGINVGEGNLIVPFMDRIWLNQDQGLLSQYFDSALFDVTGHPGVFDTVGDKIDTENLTILRSRGQSMISANVPMFSVHAQIDEYEHLFVFNNLTSPSTGEGLIYDPFSGARIVTIKMNGRRQAAETLRPEFGGHYLVGNEVRRNLQASVDKVAKYYDADHVFEDELSTRHSLALLGYSPKDYLANLDLSDHTQFNFWRGLIQMKGTNASMNSFLNNDRFYDAKLDEYWAYKVAEYGDSRAKNYPELKLTVDDTLQQFTRLMFDNPSPPADFTAFTQISTSDEERWFSLDDLTSVEETGASFEAQVVGTYFNDNATVGEQIKLPFVSDELDFVGATRLNITTLLATATTVEAKGYGPATPKFNPVKLLNYVDHELVDEIPVWHPAAGAHTPNAMAAVNIMSDIDPARYNSSTQVVGNANYDPLRAWGAKEVGRVWWDTTNLSYVPYFDKFIYTTVDERLSRWGTLADFATMDVVEWVESSVLPSAYDAQATLDAGDADLDTNTKADGQAYGAKTYYRDRTWKARPIAWSKAGVPTEAAHPSFNSSYASTLNIANSGLMYLETGTFGEFGISTGMRIGGWIQNSTETRPTSEYVIQTLSKYIPDGVQTNAVLSMTKHTDVIGTLSFTHDGTYVYATVNGVVDVAPLQTTPFTVAYNQTLVYSFATFGLTVTLTWPANTPFTVGDDGTMITSTFDGVKVYDAITVEAIVPDTATTFSNDTDVQAGFFDVGSKYKITVVGTTDFTLIGASSNTVGTVFTATGMGTGTGEAFLMDQGWRAWDVPTQADLTADSRVPNSSWYPYEGVYTNIVPTIAVIQDAATGTVLTLNDGTEVVRYQTSWNDWTELRGTIIRTTVVSSGSMDVIVPQVTVDRISVYVNGVAQLSATYNLVGTTLTINSLAVGSDVTVIIRAYSPTTEELKFDPSTADNLLIQRHYKVDYQYVEVPVRGEDGTITTTKYYFWVKNRSIAARKKTLSVKSIASMLTTGPSQYLTFQNIQAA